MAMTTNFSRTVLEIDAEQAVDKIIARIKTILKNDLKRKGLVVALSGGIDSSVTTALAVRALGAERVQVLLMPEKHSAEETADLSRQVAENFGAPYIYENISEILSAVGFYRRYDEAVRQAVPEYDEGWKSKLVIPNVIETKRLNLFTIVAQGPDGSRIEKRLPYRAYLNIVAATNFKQRIRKMIEYYHADRLHFAVAGTPNRLEYDQGFFVKLGDGAADLKPIAHLYKSQVYQLGSFLGVPEEVLRRPPTTDTYSLPQGQDEFYFSLPYQEMDLCLYALNNGIEAATVANCLGLTTEQVNRVFKDIQTKRATTRYLHLAPVLIEEVSELASD